MPTPSDPGGRGLLAALVLLLAGPALAAPTDDRLAALEEASAELALELDTVQVNFANRSGFVGAADARQRYEDAVYRYLLEDYDAAALSFYILVQSNALTSADLARDSEWYLAENLFELENYRTAEEAYRLIVEKGPAHPYFADAVRRSMEVYSLLGDTAAFDAYYTQFIVSGRVPATDLIHYTLAKSFGRRGESGRAKAEFEQVGPASPWYTRARYYLATLMIQEGNLQAAVEEMLKVTAVEPKSEDERTVRELATIARARLYYETGDLGRSAESYSAIPRESSLFADELYESVWTFIKQERWADAQKQVDVFLLEFPQHRYTAAMRILQGHLHMKLQAYERAQAAYEGVVEAYTPVVSRLRTIEADPVSRRQLLDLLTGGAAGPSTETLPGYATELLLTRDEVLRAASAWSTVKEQRRELEQSKDLLLRLQTALANQGEVLGNYVAARNQVAGARAEALALRNGIVEAEVSFVRSRLPAAQREESQRLGREQAAVLEGLSGTDGAETAAQAVARYADLRRRLAVLRPAVTDPTAPALFARFDALWAEVEALDARADNAERTVAAAEAREVEAVRQRLSAQAVRVADLETALVSTGIETERVALDAMTVGVGAVAMGFESDVLMADKGIIDVYWLRKTSTSDQMEALNEEQQRLLRELDERFRVIRENVER